MSIQTTKTTKTTRGADAKFILACAGLLAIAVMAFYFDHNMQTRLADKPNPSASPEERSECEEWEIYYVDPAGRNISVKRNLPTRQIADEARNAWDALYSGRRQHYVRCAKWRGQ